MQLGYFTMPLHPPGADLAESMEMDLAQIVALEALGYREAWVGEHFTSEWENIPCPDLFIAQALAHTRRIVLGTGVNCLPNHHPLLLSQRIAQLDQMARGRFAWGIGSGGFLGDFQLLDLDPQALAQRALTREVLDEILFLWDDPAPGVREHPRWRYRVPEYDAEIGIRLHARPYQRPHPPIALSILTPSSTSAATAGERGWIPVSGQFFHRRYLKGHWEKYVEGCERAGRRPDPSIWRVSRSVLVTESDAEAEEYLADPDNGLSFYYHFFHHSFSKGRKALFMLKPDLLIPDEDVTEDMIKRALVIAGSPRRVLEQLVALREETGHFGTLLMGGHDWDRPALWRRSMELLASEVMPKFSQHATAPRT